MKELEQYIGATYSDSCQSDIITETAATLTYPEIPNITDLCTKLPKKYAKMTYLNKNNIYEAIRQNLRKNDV